MSTRLKRYGLQGVRTYVCKRCSTDPVVKEGLSYSPADMDRLTSRGMPVNSLNTQQVFIDGEQNPPWHVTSDRTRFVDVADLWEEHQLIREKARKASLKK